MLTYINAEQGIVVSNNTSNTYFDQTTPSSLANFSGTLRFNPNIQKIEVYTGSYWQQLNESSATISLSSEVIRLLNWVRQKQEEERRLLELTENNPAVKIAYENFLKAQEQLTITTILSKDEQTNS
jgi:hypothetical protein